MDNGSIKKEIEEIIEELIGIPLNCEESLQENGIDSLLLVSLVVMLEERFSILFSDDDLQPDALETVDDLVLLVRKYI